MSCNRQYSVTVNNQTVYTPNAAGSGYQVPDPDLQGCINLALRQQNVINPADLLALSCANADVSDIAGIDGFPLLRFLDLANNQLLDLSPLAQLPQLSGLNLPNNAISDIATLLAMRTLIVVNLEGNSRIPCDQLDTLQNRLGTGLSRPVTCRP
ncbi:MAG: hypothetical protein WD772_04215 [Pseudohongiellaceae bacterium]